MKKKYIHEYAVEQSGKKAVLVYKGPLYSIDLPPGRVMGIKALVLLNALVLAALYAGMGWVGAFATRATYVGLPYAMAIIPIALICFDASRFYLRSGPMERRHYEGSFLRMYSLICILTALAGVCIIGNMVYLVIIGGLPESEYFFNPLALLLITASFILRLQIKKISSKVTLSINPQKK